MYRMWLRRLVHCASGVAAVEFALVGLLAISLVLGISEFGRAFFLRNQMAFIADVATRQILLDPPATNEDFSLIEERVRSMVVFDQSDLQISLALSEDNKIILVSLSQPLTLLVPNLSEKKITLYLNRRILLP
jgi:Flp pilus assembly pilin Flp